MFLIASITSAYASILWTILGLVGAVGALALISPRLFARMAGIGNYWIDTTSLFAKLDRRVDVDSRVLPYSRLLGTATIASVALLAFVLYGRS